MEWAILNPISLGNVICQNRIVMGAHSFGYADSEGLPTRDLEYYLEERAKGGIGLVIMGGTSVSKNGTIPTGNPTININDEIIPHYKEIAKRVHQHGTLVFDQLMHAGGQLRNRAGTRIVGPSSIHHERTRGTPLELTKNEIREITKDFARAAKRAKAGELDGVEVKCDQGFLLHQFLSPYYNKRTDEFGGNLENRLKVLIDILESIRQEVGKNFVVGVRISGDTFSPGDISLIEAQKISNLIVNTGLVDFLHVNGATNSTYRGYLINHGDSSIEEKNFSHIAREIKKLIRIPIIVSSMIATPDDAEYILKHNHADMVAMTRAHICDPEIIKKVQEDRLDDIRPCIRCNQECVGGHHFGKPVRCIHNPATGRENELGVGTIRRVPKSKKILVVGGGISGMEVARVAALRGLEVHLLEKQERLGGQVLIASKLPYMQGFMDIAHYLENQIRKLKVNIYLDNEVNNENLSSVVSNMDAIIIATGSRPEIPSIYNDIDPNNALTPVDMLEKDAKLKKNIMVVDVNWRQNPLAVAEWLQQRDHTVTIISSEYFVGEGINIASRASYYLRIHRKVTFMPLTDFVSHEKNIAYVRNVLDNKIQKIKPVDQIIFVCGFVPNNPLRDRVVKLCPKSYFVGDCITPIGITDAMLAANRLARNL